MKTKLCRPILVKSNEKTGITLGVNITRNIPGDFRGQNYQLILISSENDEIKKYDWVYNPIYKTFYQWIENADIKFDRIDAKKVIAIYPQLPEPKPKYISAAGHYQLNVHWREWDKNKLSLIPESYTQQFIQQFNADKVEDVPIEMEENGDVELQGREYINYSPKLTDGFITFIKEEQYPILYTEGEVKELCSRAWIQAMRKIVYKETESGFAKWFNENKKK